MITILILKENFSLENDSTLLKKNAKRKVSCQINY